MINSLFFIPVTISLLHMNHECSWIISHSRQHSSKSKSRGVVRGGAEGIQYPPPLFLNGCYKKRTRREIDNLLISAPLPPMILKGNDGSKKYVKLYEKETLRDCDIHPQRCLVQGPSTIMLNKLSQIKPHLQERGQKMCSILLYKFSGVLLSYEIKSKSWLQPICNFSNVLKNLDHPLPSMKQSSVAKRPFENVLEVCLPWLYTWKLVILC
jgi:hypothetical protein